MTRHNDRQEVQRWYLAEWGPIQQQAWPTLHDWRRPAKWGRGEGRIIVYRHEPGKWWLAAMDLLEMQWIWTWDEALGNAFDHLDQLLAIAEPHQWCLLPSMPEPGWEPRSVHLAVETCPF